PPGVQVKVTSIDKIEDYEQPLVAHLQVTGTLGSSTGKRVLLPGDIFVASAKPAFTNEKREIAVYFDYAHITQDAVRIKFPQTLSIESLPTIEKASTFEKAITYSVTVESTPTSFTLRRTYALGDIIFQKDKYPSFRAFYSKMENKDQESVVLTNAPATARAATPAAN
ncbi:MAG: transglutaminase, partial [Edaphobacter sp.]